MTDWMQHDTDISPPLQNSASSAHAPGMLYSVSSSLSSTHRAGTRFIPTWRSPLPFGFLITRKEEEQKATQPKAYALSVLNVKEFTITGVSPAGFSEPSKVQWLGKQIKDFRREYGNAIFECNSESPEGGKWRIPLGVYQEFYCYLTKIPNTTVQGIPQTHLNIAMLGRQRLEKGCPSVQQLIHIGVPIRLANTLEPYQRGGVDFVYERDGRALIADDMGLGKTIQAIASVAIYHEEWPVLVLTPSLAVYHWQNEFVNWLGPDEGDEELPDFRRDGRKMPMPPLSKSHIHVLSCGESPMIPSSDTKVVIVSYDLATKLAEKKKLVAGMFKCAIVDESHMLKNKVCKRTKVLMPVLAATKRCILLSGTPAFAKPMELWPQIKLLGSTEDPTLTNEHNYIQKYVNGRSKTRLAELHTVLSGTLMIRRMKKDVLTQLPPKVREQALVDILNDNTRDEFRRFLDRLSLGKGALGKIVRALSKGSSARSIAKSKAQVQDDRRYPHQQKKQLKKVNEQNVLDRAAGPATKPDPDIPSSSQASLIEMYKRTGLAKAPLVGEMLNAWLNNGVKGKLCIFAHHISVSDEIVRIAKLSNDTDSTRKFIRINGTLTPRQRQEQIDAFQTDSNIRVALLGIKAGGVAMTLTAASTVWFAELVWDPASHIQAEDRCHRIGQQARCRCLYFVAKDTLDDILWKHVENKFRDLGEFIDGKENMKMVVHKTYRGSDELRESLKVERMDFNDEDIPDLRQMDEPAKEWESQRRQDMEELQRKQQEMLRVDDTEDNVGDGDGAYKTSLSGNGISGTTTAESSETEAICLIDDDDDDDDDDEETPAVVTQKSLQEGGINYDRELPELKLYTMKCPWPSCGFHLTLFEGRVVVISKDAISGGRPNVGHILLAYNNNEVILNVELPALLQQFNDLMNRDGMIEFMFAEDKEFTEYFASRSKAADLETFPHNPSGCLLLCPTTLVDRVVEAGRDLMELYDATGDIGDKDKHNLERAIQVLVDTPMCVSLLQKTEIGKTLKEVIKLSRDKAQSSSTRQQLKRLVQSWKDMAGKSGVVMRNSQKVTGTPSLEDDVEVAKSGQTSRQLSALLHEPEHTRSVNQGARMLIAQSQPKIVTVRPAMAKPDAILNRPLGPKYRTSSASLPTNTNKLQVLKQELKVAAVSKVPATSFGKAVAFAGVGKSAKKPNSAPSRTIGTPGVKSMKAPTKIPVSVHKKKFSKSIRNYICQS